MPVDKQQKAEHAASNPSPGSAAPADTLKDPLASPTWLLPEAPAGYGGPGFIRPDSNVNPLNPMAAELQSGFSGERAPTGELADTPSSEPAVGVAASTDKPLL